MTTYHTIEKYKLIYYGRRNSESEFIAQISFSGNQNQRLGYMRFYKEGQPIPYNQEITATTPKQVILHSSENQLDRVVDMLRNEKPCSVYYSSSTDAKIYTGREPVGEEET